MSSLLSRVVEAVLILALVWILSGCQTVKGVCGDSAWLLQRTADNITVDK